MHAHHSILCITPPHMLEQIIRNGSPEQRDLAQRTLVASTELRRKRGALGTRLRTALPTEGIVGKQRTIYDAKYGSQLPGTQVREEGDPPTSDAAVNEAYDGSGSTYDMFFNIYERNSIDDHGLKLNSTVHYQKGYDNAFWDGEQMVYGDGDEDLPPDQQLFNRFTKSLDVIGHELTHGITQYEANLNYSKQPGALNESMSDVFGSLVKQYQRQHTADQADWIIGAGLFTANVNGVGIRSMKAPGTAYDDPILGKDPQPAHMKNYVNTIEDNGGVHINSGIPNHAFYVVARELGGYAWEKAGQIWYKALTEKLTTTSVFIDAANLTHQAAGELFGVGSLEQQAVQTGWAEVGITIGGPPPTNEGCFTRSMRAMGLIR
ncbi:MAG: M4 family metallopeptidase [Chloroflexi bacterium]|nr:M4 family metallopeptidase [Chloroflexota bacterium]